MTGTYTGNISSLEFFIHNSLGHVSYHFLRKKLGIPLSIVTNCESCAVSKITKALFKSVHKPASRPLEEVHILRPNGLVIIRKRSISNMVSYLIQTDQTFAKFKPKGKLGRLIGYNDKLQSYRILSDEGKIVETKKCTVSGLLCS
ncbi:hypothetical protein VP01_3770g3 [Puccinia sorghi]|uniref:GAG-pre-integrase domain-containing protein n=1 Tax=Puccinia sorghi TaxID=27349 RepID=A0A0L6UTP3_9BASI|nr:hypothetical protein VP01_3770g3 [Puccinia sorghi]